MDDFIVIGSGVSGARIAYELGKAGAKCRVLEAGHSFDSSNFPDSEMDSASQMFWGGGVELTKDARLGLLRAKCVGGTSVVNQALLDRFDDLAFDDWRDRSGIKEFNLKSFAADYDQIENEMEIQSIPEEYYNRNAKIFRDGLKKLGMTCSPIRRGQSDCRFDLGCDCIVCLKGCPRNSKQSMLVTYLPKSKELGVEVVSECEVDHIVDRQDHVEVYASADHHREIYSARRVVLAAGALGNSTVLLKSDQFRTLPALGKGFTCHPQYMTYAVYHDQVDAHKGPLQSLKSSDPQLRKRGFKLENVFAPPIGTSMLLPGHGREHMKKMRKYRNMASVEICIRDEPLGRIRMGFNRNVSIEKPLSDLDRKKIEDGLNFVSELFEVSQPAQMVRGQQGFGLHLMGGCAIGENEADSIVAPNFQMHESKNIFIADSSVFPSAPGINPSLTILALSLRASKEICSQRN